MGAREQHRQGPAAAPRSGAAAPRPGETTPRPGTAAPDADRAIHQVRADGRIVGEIRADTPVFVISVAAELAGMHAQTLRSYDREGLVSPRRATGGGRRYSQRDIELLREVQQLSQDEGVNRAGIRRIMELETHVDALRGRVAELLAELEATRAELARALAPPRGESTALVALRRPVVPWRGGATVVTWHRPDEES